MRYALEAIHADLTTAKETAPAGKKGDDKSSIVTDVFGGALWNEVWPERRMWNCARL